MRATPKESTLRSGSGLGMRPWRSDDLEGLTEEEETFSFRMRSTEVRCDDVVAL